MTNNQYLTEAQTAAILNLAKGTLSRWRWSGKGPRYHKFGGAIRYSKNDLDSFVASGEK